MAKAESTAKNKAERLTKRNAELKLLNETLTDFKDAVEKAAESRVT